MGERLRHNVRAPGAGLIALVVALAAMLCPTGASAALQTKIFDQSVFWTAPPHVTSVTFSVFGAEGGSSIYFPDQPGGGLGGRATGTIDVVPGARYTIIVGGTGEWSFDPTQPSGGGEGSVVRLGTTRLIAAGGGGAGPNGAPGGTEVDQYRSIDGDGVGGVSWGPPGTVYEPGVRPGRGLVVAAYEPVLPDTQPPVIEVTERPDNRVKTDRKQVDVQVGFTSNEAGTTFECRLDDEAYEACSSPYSVKVKAQRRPGAKHRIRVRGTDEAGNVATPVSVKFRAIRKG